ncbi:MAG: hypothetical protein KBD78_06210 [Oligoflexales bacterium]|nr:hypothetical protein [Oligoflexales bacterium]
MSLLLAQNAVAADRAEIHYNSLIGRNGDNVLIHDLSFIVDPIGAQYAQRAIPTAE